jgi:endonuclease G
MISVRVWLATFALAASTFVACGQAVADSHCPQFFVQGKPPVAVAAVVVSAKLTDICFKGYGLEHSGVWREPVWSAEHLVAANIPPKGTPRHDKFHAEATLPAGERAELSDYQHQTLYDRGHATPVGDFTDQGLRDDTFTLANMMAQTKTLNEQIWNNIENAVRVTALAQGDVYIVTGPHVTPGGPLLNNDVAVPDATWKAIYVPKSGIIGAFWAVNDKSDSYETITVTELIKRTGIDPFPGLSDQAKGEAHKLPKPIAGGG